MINIVFVCNSPKITSYKTLLNDGGSGTLLSLLNVAYYLVDRNYSVTIVGDIRVDSDLIEEKIKFIDLKEESEIRDYLKDNSFDIAVVVGHALKIVQNTSYKISTRVIYWAHNWVEPYCLYQLYKTHLIDKVIYVSRFHFLKTWRKMNFNLFFLKFSSYIYNGIEEQYYTIRNIENRKTLDLAYLSYPSKNKGFPETIELVRKLINKNIDVKLHLFGDITLYDENINSNNECHEYMLDENGSFESFLVLHGTVGKYELNEKLSSIDISIAGLTGSETYCYALVESLAKGIPVISAKTGGQTDYIKHRKNGFLVNDVDDAVIHIREYIEKDNFFQIETNSKKSIEKFFMEKIGPQWVKLIELIK